MLYKFLKIKWSHLLTLTITNDKLTVDNELLCNDFKIKKIHKENYKISYRDGNFCPTHRYPARPNPNGSGFTQSD